MLWWTLLKLNSKDWETRVAAAEALGKRGNARAVKPLIAALKDESISVQRAAAVALGQIGDARAVEPLVVALKNESSGAQGAAAVALGHIGDARAVEPLVVALKNEVPEVRETVAEVLGQIGDARAVEPLVVALKDKDWEVRKAVAKALELLHWQPMDATHRVLLAIASNHWEGIVSLGSAAVEPLVAAFRDADWQTQAWLAGALGQIGDARAVEPLIKMVEGKQAETGVTALQRILTHAAAGIAPKDLYAITQFSNTVQLRYRAESCRGGWAVSGEDPIDCSYVRQLARQELIRRGLRA